MGYLTPIMIMNDHIYYFEKDPESFAKQILDACRKTEPSDYDYNGFESAGTRHADEARLLFVWKNSLTEICEFNDIEFSSELRIKVMKEIISIAKGKIKQAEKRIKKLKERDIQHED